MALTDALAFVTFTNVDTLPDGTERTSRSLVVTHYVDGTWRLAFAMPMIFRTVPLVVDVVPGSQADAAGLGPGIWILAYAGQPVTDVTQLIDAAKEHAGDPPDTQLVMEYMDGGEARAVALKPGQVGMVLSNCLLAAEGTVTVGLQDTHDAKHIARRMAEAVCAGDTEALLSDASPRGYVIVAMEAGGSLDIVGPAEATEHLDRFRREQLAPTRNLSTMRCTSVKALVNGNLALASAQFSFLTAQDRVTSGINFYVLAREQDEWRFVAMLPALGPVPADIGKLVPWDEAMPPLQDEE